MATFRKTVWRNKKHIACFLSIFVIFVVPLLVPAIVLKSGEYSTNNSTANSGVPAQQDYILLEIKVKEVDFNEANYILNINPSPSPGSIKYWDEFLNNTPLGLSLFVGSSIRNLSTKLDFSGFDQTQDFAFSDSTEKYPFDNMMDSIGFGVLDSGNNIIPLQITVTSEISTSIVNFTVSTDSNDTTVMLNLNVWRTKNDVIFSIGIQILMWFLALGYAAMTYATVVNHTLKLDVPLSTGLLLVFSVPQLRSVQPGVPSAGTTADVAGFYWNMAIVSICVIILLGFWVFRTPHLKKNTDTERADDPLKGEDERVREKDPFEI